LLAAALVGCDALAPLEAPTPQVIIVTGEPTATPTATPTQAVTRTPIPTATEPSTPTATPYPCSEDGGQVIPFDDFDSATARERLEYRVYVPPCYLETQKRYPYVILLHGQQQDENQWEDLGIVELLDRGILRGELAPMIVVMPSTGRIGNENAFPPAASYETVLLDELIPAIERDFCTWNDRDHRALGGISRGGFWAYSIGLRHPDLFATLGGHSAYFDRQNAPPEFNPLDLALSVDMLEGDRIRMYLDNGASDIVGGGLELFSSRLSSRGVPHTYIINPVGGHDDDYWGDHLAEYMAFYARDWTVNIGALPSCLEPSP
jgi:enterochelin esterase-like enzyme